MFLEEDQDEREEIIDEDEEGFLEEEEIMEELDVDDRGHVRPRRSRFDDEGDGVYEDAEPEF